MNKVKHLALSLVAIMLVGSLAACGGNNAENNNTSNKNAGNNAASTSEPTKDEGTEPH